MDPKKKKTYIIAIVICVVASIGILAWGKFSTPTFTPPANLPTQNSPFLTGTKDTPAPVVNTTTGVTTFSAPAVFPNSSTLDTGVLSSSPFQTLQSYQPASVNSATDLGRDDPFKSY